jgi:DNA-directed RNA polymerase subunit beta|uniref:RNA polymerase subunit beta n=1 Tax=Trieres regia TaxID=1335017 RepID=UPI0022390357|nr:RNA polymerase subunit beta [Odontella regia]UYC31193.1 RNA polymerase subunit beta [Odontella regia]
MNYSTALPDFIEMQRVSFCWFIAQGLNDELTMFSRIHDFSYNTEYRLFGQEYSLVKPVYTIVRAKKLAANYSVQLVIPLEVRNKKLNSVRYFGQFTIINLPLMTTTATFVINGCERVIVSQIIRSPGIYFEKNKNHRKRKQFKSQVLGHAPKLGSFLPSGVPWIIPYDQPWKPWIIGKKLGYSKYNSNKDTKLDFYFYSLKSFKVYQKISKITNTPIKVQRIKLFLQWLKLNQKEFNFKNKLNLSELSFLLNYWNFIFKFIIKYQFLYKKNFEESCQIQESEFKTIFKTWNNQPQLNDNFSLKKIDQLTSNYEKKIRFYHNVIQQQFFDNLMLVPFLTKEKKILNLESLANRQKQKKISLTLLTNASIKFAFYFSPSLKEVFKYRSPKKRKPKEAKIKQPILYLRSPSKIVQFKDDHQVLDSYKKKYDTKDFYTATLIPESGSWIRFGFQKNTKINRYQYPIRHQEDEVIIQIDKITQKPILYLLKEMGLTDWEICSNLKHADFFYFTKPFLTGSLTSNQPLPRFDLHSDYYKNISEFSHIFDARYYRLGKIGRFQINNRLNLKLNNRIYTITYEDIFAILDCLVTLSISKTTGDDIDHLKNRRVRSVGELLQNLFRVGFQRLVRKLGSQINKRESGQISSFNIIGATVREFFGSSQLSQYMDQTNPLSSLTHRRRISGLGPGGLDRDRISFAVRDIHPSHYGRICPIETPEGQNVGLIASLTTCARVNKLGFIETPFWRVINGKVIKTGNPIYLTADIEDFYKIAPADISTNSKNYLTQNLIPVRYKQDFITVSPFQVDFISISPIQVVSVATSLIPFFEHDDANRALMGSNMQRQSVPLMLSQKPIVGTGLENQIAIDSGMTINAQGAGIVHSVTADYIIVKEYSGRKLKYILQKYQRSNQETCINHRPIVWKGEKIKSGQILTDGPGITNNELALGQNVLVAYMPWQGYNFEDAILINERLVYEDVFTSIHIERYDIEIEQDDDVSEQITKNIPNLSFSEIQNLNDDGIVALGTFVKPGDILVGKIIAKNDSEQLPEAKLLRAIFGAKAKGVRDTSFRMPKGKYGRVVDRVTFNRKTKLAYKFEKIQVFIAQIRKIKVGDKIAGRHGNKGIISRILPRQDMPFLPDGTPVDIILNPLGVPSRMNVGQLYECLLGIAGHKLNRRFKILPFDEMYGPEVSRILINKKLRQASIENDEAWLFNPYSPGKMVLIDGRTGKEFENPITVGNAYMLKLIHLVDDKMHARATGPYSLITQQPLGGKAQQGGQRFGEMEVWALEGFGAAFTLKELLTIKSDDMQGRNETLNAIVKGQLIPKSGVPESFKVLLQELRSIGLDMSTYKIENYNLNQHYELEVDLIETYDSLEKTFPPTSNLDDISF